MQSKEIRQIKEKLSFNAKVLCIYFQINNIVCISFHRIIRNLLLFLKNDHLNDQCFWNKSFNGKLLKPINNEYNFGSRSTYFVELMTSQVKTKVLSKNSFIFIKSSTDITTTHRLHLLFFLLEKTSTILFLFYYKRFFFHTTFFFILFFFWSPTSLQGRKIN